MDEKDPDIKWLQDAVDDAFAEVRRAESVRPAAMVALVVTAVPVLIFLITLLLWVTE